MSSTEQRQPLSAENVDRLLEPVSESRTPRLRRDELFERMATGDSPDSVGDVFCEPCIGTPVDVGPNRLRIFTSLDQALDEIRLIEGEDEFSGTVPVLEAMLEVDLLGGPDHLPAVMQTQYEPGENARRLSNVPPEALDAIFRNLYGTERWFRHEVQVLFEDLVELTKLGNLILDGGGLNLVQALHAFLGAPAGSCAFFRDPTTFYAMVLWLNGRTTLAADFVLPSPLEIARALHVALLLRPEPYHKAIFSAIAVACFDYGLWVLPDILKAAQPEMNSMCRNLGVRVDDSLVESTKELAERERLDPSTIADDTSDPDEIQALRYLELEKMILRENEHALFMRDRLLSGSDE